MIFKVRTTLFKVDGRIETPIAEDVSETFTDFDDGCEEFSSRSDLEVEDCLLVDLANHGIETTAEDLDVDDD